MSTRRLLPSRRKRVKTTRVRSGRLRQERPLRKARSSQTGGFPGRWSIAGARGTLGPITSIDGVETGDSIAVA